MNLLEFSVLNPKTDRSSDLGTVPMLINTDHIVSVKPINIVVTGNIIRGYWLRLSNGKKYKALKIPAELKKMFSASEEESFANALNVGNSFAEEFEPLLQ